MPVHSHARGHGHCNPPLTFKCRAFKNMVAWAGQSLFKCPVLLGV
jgi:hypothetical protein